MNSQTFKDSIGYSMLKTRYILKHKSMALITEKNVYLISSKYIIISVGFDIVPIINMQGCIGLFFSFLAFMVSSSSTDVFATITKLFCESLIENFCKHLFPLESMNVFLVVGTKRA